MVDRVGNPLRSGERSPLSDTMFWEKSHEAAQPESVGFSSFIEEVSPLLAASKNPSQTMPRSRVSPGMYPGRYER